MPRPRVLVVTGAYFPEISGGGLQARELIRALRDRADFVVLTTSCAATETVWIDGVRVHRVAVDLTRVASRARGALRLLWHLLRLGLAVDVVHLWGYSRKNIPLTLIMKLLGPRVLVSLATGGHDDAGVVKATSRLGFWSLRLADALITVNEALRDAAARAGVAPDRIRLVPIGVDTTRFSPASAAERRALRRSLALGEDVRIILFVGFFSRDKGPHRLFEAWRSLPAPMRDGTIPLFIGQTRPPHPEIDPTLAEDIRRHREPDGAAPLFVEWVGAIEDYHRAADVFVLPSIREGCPTALLEAMATGLPVISTRLPGSTDSIITDRVDGYLVPPGDVPALGAVLADVLTDVRAARACGIAARETVRRRFSLERASRAHLHIYRSLIGSRTSVASARGARDRRALT